METGIICIGLNIFEILIAISLEEQSQGLMYIDPPTPNMVFAYGSPQINKFWMKNTKAPLDIIFCHNGNVVELCRGEPYSTAVIGSNILSDMIVELPAGTASVSNIKIGNTVSLVKPTKEELIRIIAAKQR